MWLSSKEAADIFSLNKKSLEKACFRANQSNKKICSIKLKYLSFRYIDGIGAGGKVLQIWIGEEDDFSESVRCDEQRGIESISSRPVDGFDDGVVQHGQIQPPEVYRTAKDSKPITNGRVFESKDIGQVNSIEISNSELQRRYGYGEVQAPIYANSTQRGGNSVTDKQTIVSFAKAYSVKKACAQYDVNEKTLYRWMHSFEAKGAKGLKDKRGVNNKKANTNLIEEAIFAVGSACVTTWWEAYCLFYSRYNKLPFDRYALKADITYSTFFRNATKLKEDNSQVRAFLKRGLDGLDVRPTAIRNYLKENDEWQIDATKIDFMALNELGEPQRYTAIAITDTASKKRVWELFDSPNSYANVRLLKKALQRLGKPLVIKGDNGKDYISKHFQGVLQRLGIAYWAAEPFKGWQKGVIERGFRSIQHALEILPGFIGHNAGERIEAESQAIEKSARLSGAKTHLNGLLTRDELMAIIDDHIDNVYNKGWENMDNTVDLRVLGASKELTLHAQGLRYNGFFYQNLALYKHQIGTRFELIEDIDDSAKAYVYTLDGDFVCEAYDERVVSMSAEEVKAAQKEYKKNFVSGKKAIAKDLRVVKNEYYKEHAQKLLAKRDIAYKEVKENMFKKPKDQDEEVEIKLSVRASVGNQKTYRPSTDDFDNALRALKG